MTEPQPPRRRATPIPRRPIDRRTFLTRMSLAALGGPAMLEVLAACAKSTGTSAGGTAASPAALKIATPSTPVTWPISKANPVIASGLTPEKGATLRLYNYADYIGPDVVKAFEKKYKASDVKVSVSTFNDTDEALTKIRSSKSDFDI